MPAKQETLVVEKRLWPSLRLSGALFRRTPGADVDGFVRGLPDVNDAARPDPMQCGSRKASGYSSFLNPRHLIRKLSIEI
eukprot:2673433-Rhodomonas_salina.1